MAHLRQEPALGLARLLGAPAGRLGDELGVGADRDVDLDLDGRPDDWNVSCNSACQTASGLVLDTKLNDFDNDGIVDSQDQDLNGDGKTDLLWTNANGAASVWLMEGVSPMGINNHGPYDGWALI